MADVRRGCFQIDDELISQEAWLLDDILSGRTVHGKERFDEGIRTGWRYFVSGPGFDKAKPGAMWQLYQCYFRRYASKTEKAGLIGFAPRPGEEFPFPDAQSDAA